MRPREEDANGEFFQEMSAEEKIEEKQEAYRAWAKSDKDAGRFKKAYDKPFQMLESPYVSKLEHPYLATAGKYVAIAAVVYGAYKLYKKYFGKENLNVLLQAAHEVAKDADAVLAKGGSEVPKYLTEVLESDKVKAVVDKLPEANRKALKEAVQDYEQAIADIISRKRLRLVELNLGLAFKKLEKQVEKCNKVLEEKSAEEAK